MKDLMNIERGKCLNILPIINKPCPCPKYAIEEKATRGACMLCECPSVMHEEITGNSSFQEPPLSHFATSLSCDSLNGSASSSDSVVVVEVPHSSVIRDLLSGTEGSSEPTPEEIEALFPKKLPKKVQDAIERHSANASCKNAIIQRVAQRLHEEGKDSNRNLKIAAKQMQKKWSPFKNHLLPGDSTALYNQLRKKRDKLNCKAKSNGGETSVSYNEVMTPERAKLLLYDMWVKGNRNVAEYKALMVHVRSLLRKDAKKSPGIFLFKHYPYLEMKDLLLHELAVMANISIDNMEKNWSTTVPLLLDFLKEQEIQCIETGSLGEKTLSILANIHKVPLWFKKKQEDKDTAKVLVMHPIEAVLKEIQPGPRDPPRLISVGNFEDSNISIYCYLDSAPFFTEEEPVKALLLLLSAYFIIGIKWPTFTRLPLVLLTCATLGAPMVSQDVNSNNKLIDLLKRLKLM